MKVVIIGTGNVATVLGTKIMQAGHQIIQVFGRDFEKTNILASHLFSTAVSDPLIVSELADVYLIAVSDSAVQSVASLLSVKNNIVVHTAAAVSKDILINCSHNYGVIYPLQTINKKVQNLPPIPVLIDGSNQNTLNTLREFSESWAESVSVANDEERLKLHIAAVFVNNFTNHLFSVAEEYCKQQQLNFSLLLPLIKETVEVIQHNKPSAVQTGPAARRDYLTIEKHQQVLASLPDYLRLYKVITDSIITHYQQNKPL